MRIGLFVLAAIIILVVGCGPSAVPTSGPAPAKAVRTSSASGDDCLASCNNAPPNLQETCRYTCIGKMAIDKKDPSLCNQLADANMKAMCIQNANSASN